MKKKTQNKMIVVPILNDLYKVIVVWGTPAYVARIGERWQYPDRITLPEGMRGVTLSHSRCHPIIVLPKAPKSAQEIGTLAHEAYHAVQNIMDKISELSRAEEVVAHSIGAVVRSVLTKR